MPLRGECVLDEQTLSAAVVHRLANGLDGHAAVVWSAQGSEVLVHVDSVVSTLTPGYVDVRVDLEADETGRVNVPVRLAVAHRLEPPNFTATTTLEPDDGSPLAARWGPVVQDAVWGTLLGLAGDDAQGVAADDGSLVVFRGAAATGSAAG
jgi:hypothetical protein